MSENKDNGGIVKTTSIGHVDGYDLGIDPGKGTDISVVHHFPLKEEAKHQFAPLYGDFDGVVWGKELIYSDGEVLKSTNAMLATKHNKPAKLE